MLALKQSILIASPVNKNPSILREFLSSLKRLNKQDLDIYYCFVDDNDELESSEMLKKFATEEENVTMLLVEDIIKNQGHEKLDHNWTNNKIEKVAYVKNKIISYFLSTNIDYIFFVDSDLVLHPNTLHVLLASRKDIVANIFWTKWTKDSYPLPQVWLKDFYTLYDDNMLVRLNKDEINIKKLEFLHMLSIPGVYKVGGLGACTLINRRVLEAGVNFSSLYNLSYSGEDRHFCIRAVALGFELYVNTIHPAFHIFTQDELERVSEYIATTAKQ